MIGFLPLGLICIMIYIAGMHLCILNDDNNFELFISTSVNTETLIFVCSFCPFQSFLQQQNNFFSPTDIELRIQ